MQNYTQINFDGQTLFKVLQGETYTVPDTLTSASPTGKSSGVSPVTIFDAKKACIGGQLYAGFSDAAGPASPDDLHIRLNPGDVVACSAVIAGVITVTVNGVTVALISAAAVGGVLGFVG